MKNCVTYSQDVCSECRQISENFLKVIVTLHRKLQAFSLFLTDLNVSFSFVISCHVEASYLTFLSLLLTIQEFCILMMQYIIAVINNYLLQVFNCWDC